MLLGIIVVFATATALLLFPMILGEIVGRVFRSERAYEAALIVGSVISFGGFIAISFI